MISSSLGIFLNSKLSISNVSNFLYDLETKKVEWYELNDQEAIFVPKTKAHGFLTLEPNTIVTYLIDNHYAPEHDHSIPWHTIPGIVKVIVNNVNHVKDIVISDKDKLGQ